MLISVAVTPSKNTPPIYYENCVKLDKINYPGYAINSDGLLFNIAHGNILYGSNGLVTFADSTKKYRIGKLVGECFWDKPENIWENSPYKEDILLHGEFYSLPTNARKCLNARHPYGGLYWASINGDIWDDYEMRKFRKYKAPNGQEIVHIGNKKNVSVARLLANYFIPIPDELSHIPTESLLVKHKDGDKLNNHVGNLEWCTREEAHNKVKLSRADLINIENERLAGIPNTEIAKRYNISPNTVSNIINRDSARYRQILGEKKITSSTGNRLSQDKIDKVVDLINRGIGRSLIESITGVSSPSISQIWRTDERITVPMRESKTTTDLTEDQKELIFSLLEEGRTDYYIRQKAHIGARRIDDIRHRRLYAEEGKDRIWPMDPSSNNVEEIKKRNDAIEAYYRTNPGVPISELCTKFNVSTNTVKRALGLI